MNGRREVSLALKWIGLLGAGLTLAACVSIPQEIHEVFAPPSAAESSRFRLREAAAPAITAAPEVPGCEVPAAPSAAATSASPSTAAAPLPSGTPSASATPSPSAAPTVSASSAPTSAAPAPSPAQPAPAGAL